MKDDLPKAFVLAAQAGEELVCTAGGGKLHIRGCSHLTAASQARLATHEDAKTRQLCTECEAELTGQGRTVFDNLETAMEAFKMPVEGRPTVRELAGVDEDRVWIPNSGSYIALGKDGVRAVYIGKTYVSIGDRLVTLPGYAPGGGGGKPTNAPGPACPVCGYELPRTGICDNC